LQEISKIKVSLWMILIFICVLHFQLFILKHELESTSNAEKQARQMVTNLSQKIHCLQVEATFIEPHLKWVH
jgi:multidrug resistance efflux pump